MAYGLKVYSANGALQIDSSDSTHIMYQQYASGTTSQAGSISYTGGTLNYGSVPAVTISGFTRGEDLVFIQPTGSTAGVRAYCFINSNGFTIKTNVATSFRYHVFKKVTSLSAPTSDYGLVIKNSAGAHVFNQDVLAGRIKGRITGSGAIFMTGKSLYGLATLKYSRVTAAWTPNRGKIHGWVTEWNSNRDQVQFKSVEISGQGYAASTEAELDSSTYFDLTSPTTLILEAPDP